MLERIKLRGRTLSTSRDFKEGEERTEWLEERCWYLAVEFLFSRYQLCFSFLSPSGSLNQHNKVSCDFIMAPLAVRAFVQGLDGRFPRENGVRYLENEGRENGMNQALNQARAKVNAGGRKRGRKIRRGASEEAGIDGWMLTSYSGEA